MKKSAFNSHLYRGCYFNTTFQKNENGSKTYKIKKKRFLSTQRWSLMRELSYLRVVALPLSQELSGYPTWWGELQQWDSLFSWGLIKVHMLINRKSFLRKSKEFTIKLNERQKCTSSGRVPLLLDLCPFCLQHL